MRSVFLLAGLALVWYQTEASLCPPAPRKSLTGHVRTPQEMICEPCEQLFKPDSDFMQKCGQFLNPFITNKLNTTCPKLDVGQIPDFLLNLHIFCEFRGYPSFEDPSEDDCACDVCDLLFDPNSDFMRKCAFDFSDTIINGLRHKCNLTDCGSYGSIYLRKFLHHYCMAKNRKFRFPSCECDECLIFFEADSPFMQGCGAGLDDDTRDKLFETCSLCMDDVDALFTFFMTVKSLCMGRGFDPFPLPFCDCSDFCWHLFDPSRKFYDDCFSQLPFSRRLELFKECREIHTDHTLSAEFIHDLEKECLYETRVVATVPTDCISCPEVDLILVVDNSGSIVGSESDRDDFLSQIVMSFEIASDKTRIGIISYNSRFDVMVHNELESDNEEGLLLDAIVAIPVANPSDLTNTGDAIDRMTLMFNNPSGNKQIGIVLTDGRSNDGRDLADAVNDIPLGVDMFAVGVGNINSAELSLIAGGNPAHVITAPSFPTLAGKIDELRKELCD